jgi:biopolymer transport protein TolR
MRWRIRDEEHAGELNIVPYLDVVVNLVMFMLLSMTGLVALGVLNVSAPKLGADAGQAAGEEKPKLLLTVAIGKQGFYVAGAGGVLGQDAPSPDAARPPTVPLKDGRYDYAALTAQMKRIKEQFPSETGVILSAEPDTQYDVVIQTMDACREGSFARPDGSTERRPLFFDVSLSFVG